MSLRFVMPVMGRVNRMVFNVPYVGEIVVRAASRAMGSLAFRLPLVGGRPSAHIGDVRDQWLRFVGLAGLRPTVEQKEDGMFDFSFDRCPYGYSEAGDKDVCDACLDLVRIYFEMLRGRLEVKERRTYGGSCCRFHVSFR